MSGIAGIYHLDGRPVDSDLLTRMTDVIAYRGPDGVGRWIDGSVGLGHRMLHATPESLYEQQPLLDETGQLCLVLDGRVDNREELKSAILMRGARLRNDTDAEIVLRTYECWGEECPKKIIGDFAFAIWDGRKRQLFCARDFLGVKPFYYYFDGRKFTFSSELRQILEDVSVRREPNEGMIGEYLAGVIADKEETLYDEIFRLPPAHYLVVRAGGPRKERYWEIDPSREVRHSSDAEYIEHFLTVFKEAVRCRLRSPGRVGIALSGGLDSSSVAGVAQSLYDESGIDDYRVEAFSEIFPGLPCDESEYIQEVVKRWGLVCHTVVQSEVDPTVYARQARHYRDFPDYPNGAIANPWNVLVQNRGVRVLLDGVGGDEWLWGSRFHYADLLRQLRIADLFRQFGFDSLRDGVRPAVSKVLWYGVNPLLPHSVRRGLKWMLRRNDRLPDWIDSQFAHRIDLGARIRRGTDRRSSLTFAQRDLYHGGTGGFQVHALEIEDRAAAHFGFEQRHPFHDRRLVEFALALPEEQRWRHGQFKYVLRQSMRGYLPETVRQRRTKAEFSHLFGKVFESPWIEHTFDSPAISSIGWVDSQRVRQMYWRTRDLYARGDEACTTFIWSLWMILGIELWYTQAILNKGNSFPDGLLKEEASVQSVVSGV